MQAEGQALNLQIAGRVFEVETGRGAAARRQGEADQFSEGVWRLPSPLTGVVMEVLVAPGNPVGRGQVLLVVEAMKMLNELRSRVAGVVSRVLVAERERVEIGQPLVEIAEVRSP